MESSTASHSNTYHVTLTKQSQQTKCASMQTIHQTPPPISSAPNSPSSVHFDMVKIEGGGKASICTCSQIWTQSWNS